MAIQTSDSSIDLKDIPQGASSRLDADTVDGLQTSRYKSPSPGTLVPLGPDGKFPTSTIPVTPGIVTGTGTPNEIAFWSGSSVITGSTFLNFNSADDNTVIVGDGSTANQGRIRIGDGAQKYGSSFGGTASTFLELTSSGGNDCYIGFSMATGKKIRIGHASDDAFIMLDDTGRGIFLKHNTGDGNTTSAPGGITTIGNNGSEVTVFTPVSSFGVYGTQEMFGRDAIPGSASTNTGKFYFNLNSERMKFSESGSAWKFLPLINESSSNVAATVDKGIPFFTSGATNFTYMSAVSDLTFDSGTATLIATNAEIVTTLKIDMNTTGAGSASLGANSPAITNTAPYTWFTMQAGDGSTVYIPAWK